MSLVGTLGKIALGVVAAKAATSMMKGKSGGGGGLGGMLSGALGGNSQGGGGLAGGLGDALGGGGLAGGLGGLLGGGSQQQGQAPGGLGGLLGGQTQQGGSGGLGGLLDSLGGGAGAAAGGAASASSGAGLGGSLGDLLNAQLNGQQVAEPEPVPAQEDEAKILIRAMLNAAKCDGNFDAAEQEKILKQIGDITQEDADFINEEVSKPLDAAGFIASVPREMSQQVYLMSLLAIDLDSKEEAQYLDQLVKGFGMSEQDSNAIHSKLGVPTLYA